MVFGCNGTRSPREWYIRKLSCNIRIIWFTYYYLVFLVPLRLHFVSCGWRRVLLFLPRNEDDDASNNNNNSRKQINVLQFISQRAPCEHSRSFGRTTAVRFIEIYFRWKGTLALARLNIKRCTPKTDCFDDDEWPFSHRFRSFYMRRDFFCWCRLTVLLFHSLNHHFSAAVHAARVVLLLVLLVVVGPSLISSATVALAPRQQHISNHK